MGMVSVERLSGKSGFQSGNRLRSKSYTLQKLMKWRGLVVRGTEQEHLEVMMW